MKSQKLQFYLLIVLGFVLLFAHLGKLYVDIMEARNFVSAREMAEDGHWIMTTMNGVPRYEKPPLPTWLSAIFGEWFGFKNIGALRAPAAAVSLLMLIYFYKLVKLLTGQVKLAWISALVLATNFLVIYVGRRANWDIYSYAFMVVGLYYLLLAFKDKKAIANFSFAGIWFGLSVLSKGPTGPYVLLLPFLAAYLLTFGWPDKKAWLGLVICGAITVVLGFSWYGYIYGIDKENFLAIMEKEAMARGNRDVKPFTRYLSFPVQTGIWVFFSVIGLIFPLIKKRTTQPKIYMMFFYWTVFSLVLLSLIPSKKERYLFPMMVPLAVTTGYYLYYLFQNLGLKKWELTLNKIIFGILGLVALLISVGVFFVPDSASFYKIALAFFAFVCGVALVFFTFVKRNFKFAFYTLILLMLNTAVFGIPVLDKLLSNNPTFSSLAQLKPVLAQKKLKLYTYSEYSPEVWFRYGAVLPEIIVGQPKTYPKEKVFYIAMNSADVALLKPLENLGWKLTFKGYFDDNEEAAPSKNFTDRKQHFVFEVSK